MQANQAIHQPEDKRKFVGSRKGPKNTTTRGILESERQTKSDDAAKGDTGCIEMRQ